ncbi:uncharacterized protein [Antedon mediterranea]|uniref:uncharacterized protein n=1 Tax=Antedon mediterranea TaxID=105859 RepID=UPI003AF84EED
MKNMKSLIKLLLVLVFPSNVLMQVVTVTPAVVKESETATIECGYTNPPPALTLISWYRTDEQGEKEGNPLVSSDTTSSPNSRYSLISGTNRGDLRISDVVKADAGYYECNVVFAGGIIRNKVTNLTVQYLDPPSVKESSMSVLSDSTATLECTLPDGIPTEITFSWFKFDNIIDIDNSERFSGSLYNQNLTISNVMSTDEGSYRCRAENSAYSGSEGRYSSLFLDLTVNYVSLTTMEWIGGKVTCEAEGNPTPRVTIQLDQSDLESGTGSVSADVSCDTTSVVTCVIDNNVNPSVTETFESCDDACSSSPCNNQGTCEINDNGFSCECTSGFEGVTCKQEKGSNGGLIAGVIIAVIVVIVVIVVAVLYCRKRKEKVPGNLAYTGHPADVEVSGKATRQPLKTGDEKSGLGISKDLQKSNEMLFDAREDAKFKQDGGKSVGVMI